MRPVTVINEQIAFSHQTEHIRPHDLAELARVLAILKKYFVTWDEWNLVAHPGSLTVQRKNDNRLVIKVFIDVDKKLASRSELRLPLPLPKKMHEPTILGLELTHLDPITRDAMRDRLADDFDWQYCDPRKGSSKVWLRPIPEHRYDVVVLYGDCPEFLHVTEEETQAALELFVTFQRDNPEATD